MPGKMYKDPYQEQFWIPDCLPHGNEKKIKFLPSLLVIHIGIFSCFTKKCMLRPERLDAIG